MHYTPRSDIYPLQYGASNPILRTVTQAVDPQDEKVQQVVEALRHLIHDYDGVGLAAPQIGQDMRVIAITERNPQGKKMISTEPIILLNPIIIDQSTETVIGEEGCLSLPGRYGDVERSLSVTVQYTNPEGKEKVRKWTGFTSAIIQHEIDHLDGILFIDKTISKD